MLERMQIPAKNIMYVTNLVQGIERWQYIFFTW